MPPLKVKATIDVSRRVAGQFRSAVVVISESKVDGSGRILAERL
jgi:hypothetical protein